MPLTKCPECSNELSDKAISCPKCGHPFQAAAPQPPAELDALIKQALSREGKIAAIKFYREYNPNAGIADAKKYVERLEAVLPPGTIAKPPQQGFSPVVVFGGLFLLVAVGVAIYLYLDSPGGSGFSIPKMFETQYKVTLPSGDIVTMSESELVEYNKKLIKERDHAVREFTNELREASKKLEQDLKKLETPRGPGR
jgi:hypothetical protein